MEKQLLKKLSAFIVIVIMFCVMTEPANAQKSKGKKRPPGTPCNCYARPLPAGCGPICGFFSEVTSQLASFSFQLSEAANVSMKIYDVTGRLIKTLANEKMQQGDHQIEWNTKDEAGKAVSVGIYILQFDTGNKSETKKLVVLI